LTKLLELINTSCHKMQAIRLSTRHAIFRMKTGRNSLLKNRWPLPFTSWRRRGNISEEDTGKEETAWNDIPKG
jgi:hypothetical protein